MFVAPVKTTWTNNHKNIKPKIKDGFWSNNSVKKCYFAHHIAVLKPFRNWPT